jgi:two-component system sensor histidine kinase KdpD
VDELAHTNVTGSKNRKRYEDVLELIHAGINVISAVNIQHIESLNDIISRHLGVRVRERVPDSVIEQADQVVNIDVSAEDLRQRLSEGKIYAKDKIDAALQNFFTTHNLTMLRELALREVASSVDRQRAEIDARRRVQQETQATQRLMVAMSSNPPRNAILLRKASRIAGRLNTDWYCVYVQTPEERADRIDAAVQRKLVDNIQLAQSLGAEVVKLEATDVAETILRFARAERVAMVVVGQTQRSWWHRLLHGSVINRLLKQAGPVDVLVVSFDSDEAVTD